MPDPVTYTAVLPIGEPTVAFVFGLLAGERVERRTRKGRRLLGCYRHAVLVLRWFLDGTRVAQLATDNQLSPSTTYRYWSRPVDHRPHRPTPADPPADQPAGPPRPTPAPRPRSFEELWSAGPPDSSGPPPF